MKKKITIVIDASRNRSGGAIQYLKNFIKYLNIKNTLIKKIVLFSDKNLLRQIDSKPFLKKISHPFLGKNIILEIIWQFLFLPIYLKKNKIDLLYSLDSTTFCNFKSQIVFNQDLLSFDKNIYKKFSFGAEKLRLFLIRHIQINAIRNAQETIFLSKFSKNMIAKYVKKKINYSIIYHGIDSSLFRSGKQKIKKFNWDFKKKRKIKLIYVSPLFSYKNHITVAKAYERLLKNYQNLEIKFVGKFNHNFELYNKILKKFPSIKKKNFIGEVSHSKVVDLLKDSDIFIFASSSETFGISLAEAMALAMPIICSNKSSLPEILKNGGLYFDPHDDITLSNQIKNFINNKNLSKQKSSKAHNLSLLYNWSSNTKAFIKVLNKIKK